MNLIKCESSLHVMTMIVLIQVTFHAPDAASGHDTPSGAGDCMVPQNFTNIYSQRPWVRFWGAKNVPSSCTHLGPAQVMEVIIIDI